jgi:imidazole glycerol-phosphate synthase subunit HisH
VIALLDYGAGNTRSVGHALDRLGADWALTHDPAVIERADKLILPGVGAAGSAMRALAERGLVDWLRASRKPLLGVCLGLQLLYERTEEDDAYGLGLLPGVVRRLPEGREPTPHMGWNTLRRTAPGALLAQDDDGAHVYFAHSYAAPVGPETTATCSYAGVEFGAVVERGPIYATQFHPEKSAAVGAGVLRRFLAL